MIGRVALSTPFQLPTFKFKVLPCPAPTYSHMLHSPAQLEHSCSQTHKHFPTSRPLLCLKQGWLQVSLFNCHNPTRRSEPSSNASSSLKLSPFTSPPSVAVHEFPQDFVLAFPREPITLAQKHFSILLPHYKLLKDQSHVSLSFEPPKITPSVVMTEKCLWK